MGTTMQSLSFNNCDSPIAMRTFGSGKFLYKGSLSFNERELESTFSFKTSPVSSDNQDQGPAGTMVVVGEESSVSSSPSVSDHNNGVCSPPCPVKQYQRYDAAVRLQKVYKSFRTRRQLADCAVVVEQRWWKLLDFAELKRSSISFFDIEKPETALSRWTRARMRAAKVGKGLSKDARARKLALQHWLEAIDPRHRYGHNLQFYYVRWLQCESKQPFFYWLDIGEGKEVNHERCPRSKLQQQCIKYLGPAERTVYEVVIEDGKFKYRESGELLHTSDGPKDAKWIFVLSTSKNLYVGQKSKGAFQHSSFLAGGATLSAGRLVVEHGVLKAVWPHSGHYLPTEENFQEFIIFLREHEVDLSIVKKNPTEEEEEGGIRLNGKNIDSEETEVKNPDDSAQKSSDAANYSQVSRLPRLFHSKITRLKIPTRDEILDMFKREALKVQQTYSNESSDTPTDDDYESAEDSFFSEEDFMLPKVTLFDEDEDEDSAEPVPREKILRRIDSHKGMKSYQLAKQLSSTWTTGAGPRIGCMRDYPSELQCWALEQANLSPRYRLDYNPSPRGTVWYSPRLPPPTALTPIAKFDRKASKTRSRLGSDPGMCP